MITDCVKYANKELILCFSIIMITAHCTKADCLTFKEIILF